MGDSSRSARRRGLSLLGVGLSFVLLAAGCSSDDSSAGSTGSNGQINEADLGSAAPAADTPVSIGFISASQGDSPLAANFKKVEAALQMSVAYINDYKGGLGGHKVELAVCQSGETPAGSQDCANQMVNKGVIAVVEPLTSQGPAIVPVLAAAGIPFIGVSGASAQELTTKGSYIFSGGLPVLFAALAKYSSANNIKNFDMLLTDGAGVVAGVTAFAGPAFDKAGVKFTATPVAVGTADMTPQLQAASNDGADAIAMLGDATFCASFLQGYQSLGLTQKKILLGTCNDPTVTAAYPDLIKGSVGIGGSGTDPSDPDVKAFSAMAKKYSNGAVNPDATQSATEISGVLPILTLANLLQGTTGPLDSKALEAKLDTTPDFPVFLGQGSTLTCDGKAVPILTSLCGTSAGVGTMDENGNVSATQTDFKGQLG